MNNFSTVKTTSNRNRAGRFKALPCNDAYFDTLGSEQAWLLGFIAADGCIMGKQLCIGQSGPHGRQILQHVQGLLGHKGKLSSTEHNPGQTSYMMTVTSTRLVARLKELGITQRKSLTFELPSVVLGKLFCPFMRGYIDGDGCVTLVKTNSTTTLLWSYCGTFQFVQQSAACLPVTGHVRVIYDNIGEFRVHGKAAVQLGYWLWQDTSLPRYVKQDAWEKFLTQHSPQYMRYLPIRREAQRQLEDDMSVAVISEQLDIPFQTIYKWKRRLKDGEQLVPELLEGAYEYGKRL